MNWREVPVKVRGGWLVTKVDEADLLWVASFRWYLYADAYAGRIVQQAGVQRIIYLHRMLMDPPPGMEVDHWNRDGLDNRRSNLRVVTKSQQRQNQGLQANNTSGYRGVYFDRQRGRWYGQATLAGRTRTTPSRATAEEADADVRALREQLGFETNEG